MVRGLERALLQVPVLNSISLTDCSKPCPELASAMAAVLKGFDSLYQLDLTGCCLTTAGMEALAEALKDHSVEQLILMDLRDSGDGIALAKAVQSNKSATGLGRGWNGSTLLPNIPAFPVVGFTVCT